MDGDSLTANQAVIIHTATGQHRDEVHALFSDVISSENMADSEG
jgi:hypothetical protein